MDLSTTPEREALRATVRRFLADRSPVSKVLTDMETDSGYDFSLWADLVRTIGLVGAWSPGGRTDPASSNEPAGSGTFRDLAVVLEELGRSLLCAPFLSTGVLATRALNATRESYPASADHLRQIADGRLVATVALQHSTRPAQGNVVGVSRTADGFALTGTLPLVLDGHAADLVLIPATFEGRSGLFAVHADQTGVRREPLLTMDRTRRFAALHLREATAQWALAGPGVDALMVELTALTCAALACEQVGGARRCVEMATEYARTRKQFGVPIGTFQAVKHTCANMLTALELAQSTAVYAAWCVDEDPAELALAAHLAKSLCSETYRSIAADNIQVHGGIGFTWEHPAHLFYKRAKSSELFLGQPAQHRTELAKLINV